MSPISNKSDNTVYPTTLALGTVTKRITWSLTGHATIDRLLQLHLPPAATAGPIAAPDEIHIVTGAAVAVHEAEIHIRSGTGGGNLAGVLDGGIMSGETETVGIEDGIGMTVETEMETGIGVVEMIGMSGDDDGAFCVLISKISNIPVYPSPQNNAPSTAAKPCDAQDLCFVVRGDAP